MRGDRLVDDSDDGDLSVQLSIMHVFHLNLEQCSWLLIRVELLTQMNHQIKPAVQILFDFQSPSLQSPSTRLLSAFWWFFSLVMLLLYLIELHAILNAVGADPGDALGDVGLLDVVNGEGIETGVASGDFHARFDALGEDTMEVGRTKKNC